jgi:hypothetical protein
LTLCEVKFVLKTVSEPVIDGPHGGKGGVFWTDVHLKAHGPITAMEVGAGNVIESIRVS